MQDREDTYLTKVFSASNYLEYKSTLNECYDWASPFFLSTFYSFCYLCNLSKAKVFMNQHIPVRSQGRGHNVVKTGVI